MKNLLIGAALVLPFGAPASAGTVFLSDLNDAELSFSVSAGVSTTSHIYDNSVSVLNLGTAISSGVSASVAPISGSNKIHTVTTGNLPAVDGPITTTGPVKGAGPNGGYTETTTSTQTITTTKTQTTTDLIAGATNQQGVTSTFSNADTAKFVFSGATSANFNGTSTVNETVTPTTYTTTVVDSFNKNGVETGSKTTTKAVVGTVTHPVLTSSPADTTGNVTASAGANPGHDKADYTFKITTRGFVTVGFDNLATNNVADGYSVELLNVTTGKIVSNDWVPSNGTGSEVLDFNKRGTYSLIITESTGANAPDYLVSTGGVNANGAATGVFTASITGVPEASTWIMMLAGFAGLGLAGIRRTNKARILEA